MGIRTFNVNELDALAIRSGTDGFQPKYLSKDRKYFIKEAAVLGRVTMRDWMVEIIASKLCEQLGIYHVEQRHCLVKKPNDTSDAVMSPNFTLDNKMFISFESFLNRNFHISTDDSAFIMLSSYDKLLFCAEHISKNTGISKQQAFKYMLDLAIIDILVGNNDRHVKNFGVFWDTSYNKYCIARIFDCGMGLFENDPYRDQYQSLQDRYRTMYVAPYGEDPFDMIKILKSRINLNNLYNFKNIDASSFKFPNSDAKLYFSMVLKELKQ